MSEIVLAIVAVSDAVWQAVIGAISTIILAIIGVIAMVVKEYMDRQRAKEVAAKAEEVKATLKATNQNQHEHLKQQDEKLENVTAKMVAVVEKIDEVHKATNSLTDRLVETTAAEALARGGSEERERARIEAEKKP